MCAGVAQACFLFPIEAKIGLGIITANVGVLLVDRVLSFMVAQTKQTNVLGPCGLAFSLLVEGPILESAKAAPILLHTAKEQSLVGKQSFPRNKAQCGCFCCPRLVLAGYMR